MTTFAIPVEELVKGKPDMIAVPRTATIAEVVDVMLHKKVLSLPVLDDDTNKHYCLLNMSRVMGYLLNFDHGTGSAADTSRLSKTVQEMLSECPQKVSGEFHEVSSSAALREVMSILSKDGFNRVMITLPDQHPRLLTQTDVIAYLHEHPETIPTGTLAELGFASIPVHSVSAANSALTCFQEIYRHHVSAAPIVDAQGVVVGNFSASDLRHVDPIHFNGIMLKTVKINVLDFLRGQHDGAVPAPIYCTPSDRLTCAADKILKGGIHRVWVLNEQMHPVGLVTITDIIAAALAHNPE